MTSFLIPPEETTLIPNSFIDPNGRVFEWKGELYRSLSSGNATFYKDLFGKGIIPALVRDGLVVDSEQTPLSLHAGDLVLRHRKIPVVSYCFEWPAGMLKEAALLTIELCIRLGDWNLTLQDGHPWNILYEGTKPIFIDLGSIVPVRDDILWSPYQQFCNFFLFPLYLYSVGQDRLTRWLLHDYVEGITDSDLLTGLPASYKLRHPRRILNLKMTKFLARIMNNLTLEVQKKIWAFSSKVHASVGSSKVRRRFFEGLHAEVEKVKLSGGDNHWRRYYDNPSMAESTSELPAGEWQAKKEIVTRLLGELRPRSVLDLGCNTGFYSRLAASVAARVIACDKDPECVEQCFTEAKRESSDVLPLVVNGFNPPPSYGWGAKKCPSAINRFQSELVLALALIHHVVAHQRMDLERLVEICCEYSSRWLLIEYVPPLEPKVGMTGLASIDFYTPDTLVEILQRSFSKVTPFDSYPMERKLLLCEK